MHARNGDRINLTEARRRYNISEYLLAKLIDRGTLHTYADVINERVRLVSVSEIEAYLNQSSQSPALIVRTARDLGQRQRLSHGQFHQNVSSLLVNALADADNFLGKDALEIDRSTFVGAWILAYRDDPE